MAFYLTVQSRHSLVSDIVKNQSSYISWHHRRRVRATISPDFHDRSIGDMTLYGTLWNAAFHDTSRVDGPIITYFTQWKKV